MLVEPLGELSHPRFPGNYSSDSYMVPPINHCLRELKKTSCYIFQLKSLFVKSMIDASFLSTHTLNSLFVLLKYTIPLIFRIAVR